MAGWGFRREALWPFGVVYIVCAVGALLMTFVLHWQPIGDLLLVAGGVAVIANAAWLSKQVHRGD